jgi:hypothetical protein
VADAAPPGLRLFVTPAGGKSWVLACCDGLGRMRRFPLGEYPTLSIEKAREATSVMRHRVKHEWVDPIAEARRERAVVKLQRSGRGL